MLKPVDPALFSLGCEDQSWRIDLVPACPSSPPLGFLPPGFKDHAFNAPTQPVALHAGANSHLCEVALLRALRPVLRPGIPPKTGQTSPRPLPHPAGGVVSSGALLGATGGTQTHSRRTGSKLGRLRYARQGLVRVPESNTKYGGWDGITGVGAAPVMGPSISES